MEAVILSLGLIVSGLIALAFLSKEEKNENRQMPRCDPNTIIDLDDPIDGRIGRIERSVNNIRKVVRKEVKEAISDELDR